MRRLCRLHVMRARTMERHSGRNVSSARRVCDPGSASLQSRSRRDIVVTNGAEGDRTLNLRIANAALSQLSYRPIWITRYPRVPSRRSLNARYHDTEQPRARSDRSPRPERPDRRIATPGHCTRLRTRSMIRRRIRSSDSPWPRPPAWRSWPAPLAAGAGAAQAAPQAPPAWPLVSWTPIPENPVFAGTGPRHLGPQDPRARLHPGRRRRNLSPLVHRLRRRPPADHVPRPRHLARRHSLDPRPGQPDLHRLVGRGRVRRPAATAPTSCSPRGRTTSPIS